MMATTRITSWTIALFITAVLTVLHVVQSANFIFGGEAKRVCDAYKLICPAKKVCALQSIEWPRIMKFPVCVHETHVVVKSNICRKPPDPGKCRARFMRWYFNVHMGTCSWFTYSGCGGNQNKFRTAEECETRCMRGDEANFEEEKSPRSSRRREKIENVALFEHLMNAKGNNPEGNKEPKLITAPAPAAEMIELDTDVTSPLQLNTNSKNATTTVKEERRKKKKKERERKKRQKNKLRRKNRRNRKKRVRNGEELSTVEPTRKLTLSQVNPNVGEGESVSTNETFPKLVGMTDKQTTVSKFRQPGRDGKPTWRMDKQFRRWRRHHKRLQNNDRANTDDVGDPYSGAKQDTYYDKIKLFDILKTQEEAEEAKRDQM